MTVTPVNPDAEFLIEVAPGGGVVGPAQDDVDAALRRFSEREGVIEAQRRLDELRAALSEATAGNDGALRAFRNGNMDLEWAWLDPATDLEALLDAREKELAEELFGSNPATALEHFAVVGDLADDFDVGSAAQLASKLGLEVKIPSRRKLSRSLALYRELVEGAGEPWVAREAIRRALQGNNSFEEAAQVARYGVLEITDPSAAEYVATIRKDPKPADLTDLFSPSELIGSGNRKSVLLLPFFDEIRVIGSEAVKEVELEELEVEVLTEVSGALSPEDVDVIVALPPLWQEAAQDAVRRLGELAIPHRLWHDVLVERQHRAFEFTSARPEGEEPQRTDIRHFAVEPGREMQMNITRLTSKGDAVMVKCPNDELVLIDTGFQRADLQRIKELYPDRDLRIKIVVTHTHSDHLRGLKYLLEDEAITIEEIVVSLHNGSSDLQIWREIETELMRDESPFSRRDTDPGLAHFVLNRARGSILRRGDTLGDHEIQRWLLETQAGTSFEVFRRTRPTGPNDSSTVVRLGHRGKHVLLTSDAPPALLGDLLIRAGFGLRSGFLKWPHHLWTPNTAERATMGEFLRAVNPHTVILSNVGEQQGTTIEERRAKIRQIISEELGPAVKILWTGEHGTVRLISEQLPRSPGAVWVDGYGFESWILLDNLAEAQEFSRGARGRRARGSVDQQGATQGPVDIDTLSPTP